MRILVLSDIDNPHTQRWMKSQAAAGNDIHLFGFGAYDAANYEGDGRIRITSLGLRNDLVSSYRSRFKKWRYLLALPHVKRIIREFGPDLVHAHFATSYGLLGALCGFRPLVLTVWGSDILVFPRKSRFFRRLVAFNLARADAVTAASGMLARETERYTRKRVAVVPFGINLSAFGKRNAVRSPFPSGCIVVGTIRNIRRVYGIDCLVKAFALARERYPELPLKLLVVGSGYPDVEAELRELVAAAGLQDDVVFWGAAAYGDIPDMYGMLDIYVNVSRSESFGVAVVEASASGLPVVVSDVGGLPEVVERDVTGYIVPVEDERATADAVLRLAHDPGLRERMGRAGRERTERLFDLDANTRQMTEIYETLAGGSAEGRRG